MVLSPSIAVITFYAPSSSGGKALTILMVSTLTVVTRFTRSMMYRGSPISNPQSFGLLTIPLSLSVVTR